MVERAKTIELREIPKIAALVHCCRPYSCNRVDILASRMSHGTSPYHEHWHGKSCRGWKRVVLQCLIRSGKLPQKKKLCLRLSC